MNQHNRPALEVLNTLNMQLERTQEEKKMEQELKVLENENKKLKSIYDGIQAELVIEKKLRTYWG